MKIFLSIVAFLLALGLAAMLVVAFKLGTIVKKGVNHAGPKITQTSVVLEDADVSLFSGKGTLKGLTVGNPAGWTTPRAFYLGEISIDLEPRSVTKDTVVINSILIDAPEITYETRITTSNLQDLLKNIQSAGGASTGTAPSSEEPSAETKPVKLIVKSFRLQNAKVVVAGAGTSVPVELPTLALNDLGTREGGLTPEQLASAVLKEITAQVAQVGTKKAIEKGVLEKLLK